MPKPFCFGDKQIQPLITLLDVVEQLADIASSHRHLDAATELELKPALLLQPRYWGVGLQDSHKVVGSNNLGTKMLLEFGYTLGSKSNVETYIHPINVEVSSESPNVVSNLLDRVVVHVVSRPESVSQIAV